MTLHNDIKTMTFLIRAASEKYNIKIEFIEKDYWITHILQKLSRSNYIDTTVFKGGTSLSKAYNLINRFSEDIDLAILSVNNQSGNNIKNIIRNIEKHISNDLEEKEIEGITSKGSRFRKSIYHYKSSPDRDITSPDGRIIIEINSFANPYPFVSLDIESFIAKYLREINRADLIKEYDLDKFSINVLDARQTLVEKLVSLIRFSHLGTKGLSSKIRHFYDIYYLLQNTECSEYIKSEKFATDFITTLNHDKKTFTDPDGWQSVELKDIPLLNNTETIWKELTPKYYSELSELAFSPIPNEQEILNNFNILVKQINT